MSKVTVTSPVPDYTGVTAGIAFADGKGEFDPTRQHAAARYFDRHGYTYPKPGDEQGESEPSAEPTKPAEPDAADSGDASKPADDEQGESAESDEPAAESTDEQAKPARGKTASK